MPDLTLLMNLIAKDRASQVLNQVAAASDKAGAAAKRHGDHIEHAGHRGSKAMGLLARTITGASAGSLGPLQEVAEKFEVIDRASELSTSKIGGRLLGIGAAALGAGALLSTLASREQEAQQRLQASVEASGKSFDDYAEQVEKAVKSGEHFGNQASTTLDALNRLTITTHDPAEALHDLSVAQDVAAAKGISLAKAAELVGLTFNGSTRAGKQFGLHLTDVKKATNELAAAQKNLVNANEKVSSTQQAYNQKLAVYTSQHKHTLAGQQALYNAYVASQKATAEDAAAKVRLKAAQEGANAATKAGATNVAQLAKIVKNQAEANADSFSGHLRTLGARIEDTAGKLGKDYGGAIQVASLATIAVGSVIESGLMPKLLRLIGRTKATGAAFEAAASVEAAASARGAAAIVAGATVAERAMLGEAATAEVAASRIARALAGARVALGGLLGLPGLVAAAGGAAVYETNKYVHDHPNLGGHFYRSNPVSNFLFGKSKRDKGEPLDFTATGADELSVQNRAQGIRGARPHPAVTGSRATTDPFAAFLTSLPGGGSLGGGGGAGRAGSHASAAEKAARIAIKAYQDELRAKIAADRGIEKSDRDLIASTRKRQEATKSLLATYRDYAKGIADTSKQFTDAISAFGTLNGPTAVDGLVWAPGTEKAGQQVVLPGSNNAGGLIDALGGNLGTQSRFTTELAALAKRGLSKTLISQLLEAGPSQIQLVDALFGADSGQIGALNSEITQGNTAAAALGKLGIATKFGDTAESKALAEQRKQTDLLGKQIQALNAILAQEKMLATELAASLNGVASGATRDGRARVAR